MSPLAKFEIRLSSEREKDADWLASQLRTHRLTVLQGQRGSGKTTLLEAGLLPRLQRRASDPSSPTIWNARPDGTSPDLPPDTDPPRAASNVINFPDRRQAGRNRARAFDGEIVVAMDASEADPLDALWKAMHRAMNIAPTPRRADAGAVLQTLSAWHRDRGLRFLIVLDDFDACLKASVNSPVAVEFIDEWVLALSDPRSPANFLVCLSEPAEPLWRLLRHYLVVQDDLPAHRLQLAGVSLAAPARPGASTLAVGDVDLPSANVSDSDFLTGSDLNDPDADREDADADAEAASVGPRASTSLGIRPATTAASRRLKLGLAAVCVAAASFLATRSALQWWHSNDVDASAGHVAAVTVAPAVASPVAATPSSPRVSPAVPLATPGYELVTDASDSSDHMIMTDMARLLTPKGSAAPRTVASSGGWRGQLSALGDVGSPDQARLAVATYDVLQAARQSPGLPPLRVVTPLFSDEIYFLVRQDSPLRFIHDIRGERLNIGPRDGSRALTANGVYRSMFGSDIPVAQGDTDSREQALEHLLADKSVDVIVLVGAQPDPWLTGLLDDRKRRLRILEFDPSNPASRRATAVFLPTRVTPGRGSGLERQDGTMTLALMTFLVTGQAHDDSDPQILKAVNAICRNLPGLRATGHPKWREVQAGMPLDTGWPNAQAAAQAFSNCTNPNP